MLDTSNVQRHLAALFLISLAEIAFELCIMRIFSIGSWSNFGALVISTALLGIGLSGILLSFFAEKVRQNANSILRFCAMSLAPAMALSAILAQMVPFNPVFLGADSRQVWFIAAFFILYGVPFFIGASFVGTMFIAHRDRIRSLYFWNMSGSGLGGFFIIGVMFLLPPDQLLLPILTLSLLAAFLVLVEAPTPGQKPTMKFTNLLALSLSAVIAFGFTFALGGIKISDYKAISYVRKYPDSKLVHHSWGPGGEFHVYASSYFHFAPGLSDNAALKIPIMPRQPFWGLFIDGNGPIGIMGAFTPEEAGYLDYLPMAAPYIIKANPKVLLVNLGGGINAQVARYKGAQGIDIVEPSSELISLLRDDSNIRRFNNGLLTAPGISLHEGDPRAWSSAHKNTYDLVEISLVDSIGLSDSGGYAVHENFTYTKEAFGEYLDALKDDGILSLTVWDRLNPPRNVLRLMTTLVEALREKGFERPQESVFAFNLFLSTATIMVKKGNFTEGELYDLRNFTKQRTFEILHDPISPVAQTLSIEELLKNYAIHFDGGQTEEVANFTSTDMYKASFETLFSDPGKSKELIDDYVFDIRPMTDERPYYSAYMRPERLPSYLDQLPDISEEWGQLLILGMLAQAIFFGLLVMFVPLAAFRGSLFSQKRGTAGVIIYYASLGLSYMLIELFLIQRLGVFLSNPTYSTSIVITIMLVFSALGNLVAGKIKLRKDVLVAIACALIVGGLVFYLFSLDSFLADFRSSALWLRILLAAAVIAPLAFVLGVPYPSGLDTLQEKRPNLLPWAWGMNGGLSVAGASLARVISVSSGFFVLLLIPLILYIVVAVLYRSNGSIASEAPTGSEEKKPALAASTSPSRN